MRAFAIDRFGADGYVRVLPDPVPSEGEVLVRVEAASVNPADVSMLHGAFKAFMEHRFPLIPGFDLAGVVESVGPGIEGFRPGDPVFGAHGQHVMGAGSFAELVVASGGSLARRPAPIDAAFGTALSLAGVSALSLVDAASPRRDDTVVVIGASGGIGSVALQLLAAAGARPIGVCLAANHGYIRELGAAEAIDYTTTDVVDAVRSLHPDGVAAVFDLAGDSALNARLPEVIRPGGSLASMAGGADVEALATRGISGVNIRTQVTAEALNRLASLATEGRLRRPEIHTLPLAEAGSALAQVGGRHVTGKLVIEP
jgi:NADPH2:quinone reductase